MPAVPQEGAVRLDIVPVRVGISSAVRAAHRKPAGRRPRPILIHIIALVLQVKKCLPGRISALVEIILLPADLIPAVRIDPAVRPRIIPEGGGAGGRQGGRRCHGKPRILIARSVLLHPVAASLIRHPVIGDNEAVPSHIAQRAVGPGKPLVRQLLVILHIRPVLVSILLPARGRLGKKTYEWLKERQKRPS